MTQFRRKISIHESSPRRARECVTKVFRGEISFICTNYALFVCFAKINIAGERFRWSFPRGGPPPPHVKKSQNFTKIANRMTVSRCTRAEVVSLSRTRRPRGIKGIYDLDVSDKHWYIGGCRWREGVAGQTLIKILRVSVASGNRGQAMRSPNRPRSGGCSWRVDLLRGNEFV